ncbi:MAG: hypothetical protein NVSMB31_11040 [Vulcanimicrobiaceae bacterium]
MLLTLAAIALAARPATAEAPKVILPSAMSLNTTDHTAVLPLYRGVNAGRSVWYIITDASDAAVAKKLRVVYAPSLGKIGLGATQHVTKRGKDYVFEGAPDFSPSRTYVASPGGFPPVSAMPGAIADAAYSPFVHADGIAGVLNASIVATGNAPFDVITHSNTQDRVVAIDTQKQAVTLALARGFFNVKPIYYISPEASDPVAAAVERATYVPKLAKAQAASSIPIGVVINGPQGMSNGQGLAFLALRTPLGEDASASNIAKIGSPFNLLSLIPDLAQPYSDNAYSPLWSVQVVPDSGAKRVTSYGDFAALGTKAAGFVVNCPVIAFGDENAY